LISDIKFLSKTAVEEATNEITDYIVYKKLSVIGNDKKNKQIFRKLSKTEYGHYLFWKQYCVDKEIHPKKIRIYLILFLRQIFGNAFAIKYLEKNEQKAVKEYKSLQKIIPEKENKAFKHMIIDEEEHEKIFAERINTEHIKYMSFIVLGLADALVEIAGIHAGSLGIYSSTELTGLAGIVAGAAASLSMASAAYAQAKQGFVGSAKIAAMYTGISYFISAIILASPYFFTSDLEIALIVSLIFGTFIIATVTWYNSIMTRNKFKKNFLQLTLIMVAATIILFFFGLLIKHIFGITI
jgi:VIT1/CCC1 family predicted Fe2+/Mn2+ transporter